MKQLGIEFKVGLFTLLGLAATGYLFLALTPDLLSDKEFKVYYTHLMDATGIIPKTHVKTNGVSIGKVQSVELGVNTTKVYFEVESGIKIPKGSKLKIDSRGLLGDSFLAILRSDDSGEYLADGEMIPQSTDSTDLNGLIEIAGKIANDIKQVTGNLADVLGTEEGKAKIDNIVNNVDAATEAARGILADNRDDIRTVVANLREILDDENKDKIDRIIAAFDDSMEEVRGATKNINLISARVESGQGTLGKLINDDGALEELQGAITDIRDVLSPATKLQIEVDAHLEGRSDDSSQGYFDLRFKTRPDRYYLIGFTDLEEDEEEERTKALDDDGENGAGTRTTIKRKKALRFNLQFAKRWYFFALRFGFFESTGGMASDFYLFKDRIRFALEAWDWKTTDNEFRRVAHLKAYASVLFFNHVYLMAGIDDPTKYKTRGDATETQDPNWFFGAGLTFNDQDLKALFGAAALGSAVN